MVALFPCLQDKTRQDKYVATKISMLQQTAQLATKIKEGGLSRQLQSLSQHKVQSQQCKTTRLCHDKEKVCCENRLQQLRETLSRQKKIFSRQRLRRTTNRISQHSKECCNKVEKLKTKNSVVIKDNSIATKDGNEIIEDCHDIV